MADVMSQLRLRGTLREFFPAAVEAFKDLTAPEALELLGPAPDPTRAAQLSRAKIAAALKRARRRDVEAKAEQIQAILRAQELRQPPVVERAYATIVASQVRLITAMLADVAQLEVLVGEGFGRHPDADPGRPRARRVRRRPAPLRRREGPQELRRHLGSLHPPAGGGAVA
jgi:hypothetical protein